MRVIFKLKKRRDWREFEDFLGMTGIVHAVRFRVLRNDIERCYIVDRDDFHSHLVPTEWVESRDTWFEVTACNKQYITECKWADKPKYLGSMCQVDGEQAMDHVFSARNPYNNWYLIDTETGDHWIPLNQNPNRVGNHTSHGLTLVTDLWPVDPRCPQLPESYYPT